MAIPLEKDERILMETSSRYMGTEGTLLFTDRRLIFYCMIKEYLRPVEYDLMFDVPLDAILSVSSKGFGLSMLHVETDTKRITGNSRHEFFIIDAHKWAEAVNRFLSRQKKPGRSQPPGAAPGFGSGARPSPPGKGNVGKLCLGCMKVVPESARVCPNCGNDV